MFYKKKPAQTPPGPAGQPTPTPPRPEWHLATLTQRLGELAPILETKEIEPPLVQARLADHYRDLDREPVPPARFQRIVRDLDGESWRRLALAVWSLDLDDIRSPLALLPTTVEQQVEAGFAGAAAKTDALTLTVLRQSEVRVEEFARHLAHHLGVSWQGESRQDSERRLQQIDYKRLLAEAEEAKRQAQERMEYLRKKQEEAGRRRPRGKQ
jgi:hypothetical protein